MTCGGEVVGTVRATKPRLPVERPAALVDRPPYFFVTRVHARDHGASAREDAGDSPERSALLAVAPDQSLVRSALQRMRIATGATPGILICRGVGLLIAPKVVGFPAAR